jgi:hypothetical protein
MVRQNIEKGEFRLNMLRVRTKTLKTVKRQLTLQHRTYYADVMTIK